MRVIYTLRRHYPGSRLLPVRKGPPINSPAFQRWVFGYFLSRLVWLATHSHRPSSKIQVSVKRPRWS
jgi:hypothetical protein